MRTLSARGTITTALPAGTKENLMAQDAAMAPAQTALIADKPAVREVSMFDGKR